MAALSLATDLGMGQPLEFALTSCVLATRLGESLGMSESELRDVYYSGAAPDRTWSVNQADGVAAHDLA